MDDDVVRIAVGLRLGAPLCRPHACQLCGAPVDEQAIHGLSCASGVLDVNHAMLQLMTSSRELCHQPRSPPCWNPLALVGLTASGLMARVTIAPWKSGRVLVWDVSCTDTFTSSHLAQGVTEARAVAGQAEMRKRSKYEIIARTHHFVLVVVETSGAFGTEALDLFAEIARRVRTVTQEVRARAFLLQQVSVALQRGNAASVLGSMGSA